MNTVSVDREFLEHCLSVMRGVGELCQPIPRKSEDDPTEYCGGQALAELANCYNKLQETIAYAEQAALPQAEQPEAGRGVCSRCHGVDGDCDALMSDDPAACPCRCHEPQVQEAGRDGDFSFAYIAGMLDSYAACIHEYAPADDFARWHYVPEIQEAATWLRALRPQAQEAVAYTHPAHAEAVRVVSALRSLWRTKDGALVLCNASVSTIEAACREADTFLAQHGGRGDVC